MSIIDKNAVFIIGAGTSAVFGMPLGANLIENIATQIGKEIKKTKNHDMYGRLSSTSGIDYHAVLSGARGEEHYEKYPISSGELFYQIDGESRIDLVTKMRSVEKNLFNLMTLLNNQTSDTIDDFIVENEKVARLTKLAIASMFMKVLYERKTNTGLYHIRNLDQRNFKINGVVEGFIVERNWIHHLINLVRKAVQIGDVSSENKVKIISFNYDNILEYVLDKQFQNTGYEYNSWREYIEVLHPHGQCGTFQEKISNPAEMVSEWAQGIYVVNEKNDNVSEQVIADREKARKWMETSKKIYALGFAFSGPNLRLLGLNPNKTPHDNRFISYCNYDGNVGLRRNLLKFERKNANVVINNNSLRTVSVEVEEAEGSSDALLGCSDWFKLGYAGELPS